jgi:hypothetical protein
MCQNLYSVFSFLQFAEIYWYPRSTLSRHRMYSQPADNKWGDMIGNVLFNSFTTVCTFLCLQMQSKWGSSVSIVFDYGLDDWVIRVQSSAEAKDFPCSLCVQTSSGANPASYPMGAGGPFPGITHGRGVMLTTHPIQC